MFYDKEFLGKKFKEYRKKAKLTQEELSEKIGIAEKHYGKLERGAFTPSLETFFKLIETLKIPFEEFGIMENPNNGTRAELIKEIYILNETQLDLYLEIAQSVKKHCK